MEIGKNDVIGFVNSLTYENPERKNSRDYIYLKGKKDREEESSSQIQLDRVRSKAMRLDDKIREYQNLITNYQMQSKFLGETGKRRGWQEQLLQFLKKVTSPEKGNLSQNIPSNITFEDYTSQLEEKIQIYQKKLGRGQVQLQNIFASGLLTEPNINKSFTSLKNGKEKDIEGLFKNLRVGTVHNLLS